VPYLILPLISFLAAITNAVAGGGTFFLFPSLIGVAGMSEKAANITCTIALWPGSASSVVAAKREFHRLPRGMVIVFVLLSIIGGILGALLLRVTSVHAFKLLVPWLLLAATVIFAFSKPIARWAGRQHGQRSLRWTALIACVQFIVAIYGGYFGAGIGILMLAGLAFAGLDDIHQMNALKVLLQTTINGVASIVFFFGPIDWALAAPMAALSIVGGFTGITVARHVPQTALRAFIIAVGAVLTGWYFWKAYG
jgi:uncharacterized membrane protein YfcA